MLYNLVDLYFKLYLIIANDLDCFNNATSMQQNYQKILILSYIEVLKTLVIIVVRRLEKCLDFVRSLDISFFLFKIRG